MVLHTVDFESQDELLNPGDFDAAWSALGALGRGYLVIFNGGKDAGASLNHKHLQVVPRAERGGLEGLLGADEGGGGMFYRRWGVAMQNMEGRGPLTTIHAGLSNRLKEVPFSLAARSLPSRPEGGVLNALFLDMREELRLRPGDAYNMVLYHHHMLVIPRRTANIDGVDANAAGMTGMVWCSSEEQYQEWLRRGPMEWLLDFGVPKEGVLEG